MSIAPYQQAQNGVAGYQPPTQVPPVSAVAQLTEWAHGAQAAYQVAENLVTTSFCPKHYAGKPHEATAAILAGLEVGLSPMASLQAFHSIQGTAAPKAITLRAIVQSKGHTLDVVESSATRAVVVGRRNGTGAPQRSEWTIERAQQAGYPGKNPNWKSQPEFMLIARATAECARMVASDAILGIPYAVEELEDGGGPVRAVAEQTTPPAPVVERRRNRASVLPVGADSGEVPVGVPSTRLDPKGAVIAQLRDALQAAGYVEAGTALAFLSEVAGREVRHPKELTHAEAREVLGRLAESAAETSGDEK